MYETSAKVDLAAHCKNLYQLAHYAGFLPFKYNQSTCRFEDSIPHIFISRIIYICLKTISAVYLLVSIFFTYWGCSSRLKPWESTHTQDGIVEHVSTRWIVLATLLIARCCLTLKDILVPTLNELLEIYKIVKDMSDSTVYCPTICQVEVIMKICFSICRFVMSQIDIRKSLLFSPDIFLLPYSFLGHVLYILMSFAHLYSKLVLICFYIKMTQFLKLFSHKMTKRQRTISVGDIISISQRIGRVKRTLDGFFTGFFMATYFGLFCDMRALYNILKKLIYPKIEDGMFSGLQENKLNYYVFLALEIPDFFSSSFEIFLIGQLSDILVHCEKILQRRVLALLWRKRLKAKRNPYYIERQVELMLLQSKINCLDTLVLDEIKFDKAFAYDYAFNLIIPYVIVFLQFFASEVVYA